MEHQPQDPSDYRQPPIATMQDCLISQPDIFEEQEEAYYIPANNVMEGIQILAEGSIDGQATITELTHNLALSRRLLQAPAFPLNFLNVQDPFFIQYLEAYAPSITAKGISVEDIKTASRSYTTDQMLEYQVGKLETCIADLTGDNPVAEPDPELSDVVDTARLLAIAIDVLPEEPAGYLAWQQRYQSAVTTLASQLLHHDKIGLAMSFGSLSNDAAWSEQFITDLVPAIDKLRNGDDDYDYRTYYNHATSLLRRSQLQLFTAALPPEPARQLFASERTHRPEIDVVTDRFEQGRLKWASTADGPTIALPYVEYLARTTLGYATGRERDLYKPQANVAYESLDDAQKAAVATALRVDDGKLLETETLPEYKRLALWPADEPGDPDKLYTVIHRPGYGRLMDAYPDHHGFVTSDKTRQLDLPVKHIETVADSYMVCRYNNDYILRATFDDAEVNFFAPADTVANAFWISGNPRIIYSEADQHLSLPAEDAHMGRRARFIIVPIRFYKIAEDSSGVEAEQRHEDMTLVQRLGMTSMNDQSASAT